MVTKPNFPVITGPPQTVNLEKCVYVSIMYMCKWPI